MMDEFTRTKLELETSLGDNHQRIWDTTVAPFFEAKEKELYQAFINLPISQKDSLVDIKMQQNVLRSLEDHFKHFINTGQLARKTLEDDQDGNS